jgi:hypothetical protein
LSFKIYFLKTASFELNEAFNWYEKQKTALGAKFVEEVDYYLNFIQENPYYFSKHIETEELRTVPLKLFPYIIIYWVVEERKIIYIDAVFHAKRNPKNYRNMK